MIEKLLQRTLYITEGRDMRPFDAKRCLPEDYEANAFVVDTLNGVNLPGGLSLDEHGVLRGVPVMGTSSGSPYKITVDINDEAMQLPLEIHIGEQLRPDQIAYRQGKIWKAFEEGGDIPADILALVDRPVTKQDVYHLVERYASFTVWNSEDLRLAENGRKVKVDGVSEKFNIYDFDVCLVASPVDLLDDTRGLQDALTTARAMAKEVHRRRWHVEFSGFDRMAYAAFLEIQSLNSKSRHKTTIKKYTPPGMEGAAGKGMEEQPEPE